MKNAIFIVILSLGFLACEKSQYPGSTVIDTETGIPEYYLPEKMQFISWDFPNIAHTGVDIDYKLTGYDYFNRQLNWSIESGPSGMAIDADGTLHWTPETEEVVDVSVCLSFDGQNTITKEFKITVDDSKCIFIAPDGSNTSGDGSIDNPFAVFGEEVATAILAINGGCTVYNRGGNYENVYLNWFDNTNNPNMRRLDLMELEESNPIIIRNYPSEHPIYNIIKNGFRLYRNYWILYGIEVDGGTGGEAGGLVLGGKSVGKCMYIHNYNHPTADNPTGVRISGNVILDQVIAGNNYDRTNPEHHNSSNFLIYGTGDHVNGNIYIINCLSLGFSACGFKIKHAGDASRVHLHKSADVGTLRSWAGAANKAVIRHSYFISSENSPEATVLLGATDPSTGGEVHLDEGMLIENNLIVNPSANAIAISQASWAFNKQPETPALWKGNTIESYSTKKGNVFAAGYWSSNIVPDTWNLIFMDNKVYTLSDENSMVLSGDEFDLYKLFTYGENNEKFSYPGSYTFKVAGKTFTVNNGVVSGQ